MPYYDVIVQNRKGHQRAVTIFSGIGVWKARVNGAAVIQKATGDRSWRAIAAVTADKYSRRSVPGTRLR